MRDLRAELRDWKDTDPIRWQPDEGGILVGFLRDPLPADCDSLEGAQVTIEEERTGIAIAVDLNSPVLAGLFDLHHPRVRDRIGIKYTGTDASGVARFIMVIDRDPAPDAPADEDTEGATAEERDYIEQMMADTSPPETSDTEPPPAVSQVPSATRQSRSRNTPIPVVLTMLVLGALLALCPQWLAGLFR